MTNIFFCFFSFFSFLLVNIAPTCFEIILRFFLEDEYFEMVGHFIYIFILFLVNIAPTCFEMIAQIVKILTFLLDQFCDQHGRSSL